MSHLWLVGMMGTGKTTIGAIVAEQSGRPFIDVDSAIMERSGETIPELFAQGEDVFRRWESTVIAEIAPQPSAIVATGGGSVLATANVEHMQSTGRIVLLTASTDTIESRIGDDPSRPLAGDADAIAALAELRRETYRAVSDTVVDTDGRDLDDIAEEVLRCVPIS